MGQVRPSPSKQNSREEKKKTSETQSLALSFYLEIRNNKKRPEEKSQPNQFAFRSEKEWEYYVRE